MTSKKLKIIGSITLYVNANRYDTYKQVVTPLKEAILSGGIKVTSSDYTSDFNREYYPYTKEIHWGGNLDDFTICLDSNMKCELSHYRVNSYSSRDQRELRFKIHFILPKKFIPLFQSAIDQEFYYHCCELRQDEINLAEEKRIAEIGENLLKD